MEECATGLLVLDKLDRMHEDIRLLTAMVYEHDKDIAILKATTLRWSALKFGALVGAVGLIMLVLVFVARQVIAGLW
jgi:hypothetical protein